MCQPVEPKHGHERGNRRQKATYALTTRQYAPIHHGKTADPGTHTNLGCVLPGLRALSVLKSGWLVPESVLILVVYLSFEFITEKTLL